MGSDHAARQTGDRRSEQDTPEALLTHVWQDPTRQAGKARSQVDGDGLVESGGVDVVVQAWPA